MTDREELKAYYKMLKRFGLIDGNQKLIVIKHELEKDPYKRMCLSVAEGYEVDRNGCEIFNEFGKIESYDSFLKRHPTFAADVKKAVEEVVYYEDRKVLCDGCEEECKYSESDDFTKALAECIHQAQGSVVDPLVLAETWKDELIKLAKSEEPVSEIWHNCDEKPKIGEVIIMYDTKYPYPECGYLVDERKFIFNNGSMDWEACNLEYERWAYFSDLRHKKEEPVSEELEEAAKRYGTKKHPMSKIGTNESACDFKAGAKWDEQKKAKDAIDCEISEVEVDTCGCGLNSHTRLSIVVDDEELRNKGFKDGDKCKVVILKDTPEYIDGVKGSYTTTTK